MSTFWKDLNDSNNKIVQIFENSDLLKNFDKKLMLGKNSGYDLELTAKIEIKEDKRVATSNNVAIEYMHNSMPTGISTTTAQFYLLILHTKNGEIIGLVETKKIREWIRDCNYVRKACGPDGSELFLFSLDFVLPRIKHLTKD